MVGRAPHRPRKAPTDRPDLMRGASEAGPSFTLERSAAGGGRPILNRIQAQPGVVYEAVRLVAEDGGLVIEAVLRPRALRRPTCSGCTQPGRGYDTLARRRFEFVPLWGLPVFFCYAMRRVACPTCGVRVETVPWATGKPQLTTT